MAIWSVLTRSLFHPAEAAKAWVSLFRSRSSRFVYHELKEHGIVANVTIGAHAQSIKPALAAGLKLPQDWGVILSDIDPGSPAAAAGLKAKDVVTTMDGLRVDALPKYTAFLYVHKRDTPIKMEVLRDGKPVTVSVTPSMRRRRLTIFRTSSIPGGT